MCSQIGRAEFSSSMRALCRATPPSARDVGPTEASMAAALDPRFGADVRFEHRCQDFIRSADADSLPGQSTERIQCPPAQVARVSQLTNPSWHECCHHTHPCRPNADKHRLPTKYRLVWLRSPRGFADHGSQSHATISTWRAWRTRARSRLAHGNARDDT